MKEIYRTYFNPPSRSEEEENQFMRDIRETERQIITQILLILMILSILALTSDIYVYEGETLKSVLKTRAFGIVLTVIWFIGIALSERLRFYSAEWTGTLMILAFLGTSYLLGSAPLSIDSWKKSFFFCVWFVVPGATAFYLSWNFRKRIIFNFLFMVAVFSGFFILNSKNFHSDFILAASIFYGAIMLLSILGGHMVSNLYRRSYFLQQDLEDQKQKADEERKRIDNHAKVAAELSFEMMNEVKKYKRSNDEHFDLRIGMNAGPVVAGVIGTDKFVYDVWGDTVNVGSRMESQGVPVKIQVTPSTKQAIEQQETDGQFEFEKRGIIGVKGKGKMTTYFLEKQHQNLSNRIY